MNRLVIIAALLLSMQLQPLQGFAAESGERDVTDPEAAKDLCLLYLVDCDMRVHSIQDKIEKLNEEIAKGTRVYTAEELRILQGKLKEASRILNILMDY